MIDGAYTYRFLRKNDGNNGFDIRLYGNCLIDFSRGIAVRVLKYETLFDDDSDQYLSDCTLTTIPNNMTEKDFMYETMNTRYRVCSRTNWIGEAMLAC